MWSSWRKDECGAVEGMGVDHWGEGVWINGKKGCGRVEKRSVEQLGEGILSSGRGKGRGPMRRRSVNAVGYCSQLCEFFLFFFL